jgi:hypothetical protein
MTWGWVSSVPRLPAWLRLTGRSPRSSLHAGHCLLMALSACLGAAATLLLLRQSDNFGSPYGAPVRPTMTVPVSFAGVTDDRARFRKIFCALDAQHGSRFAVHRLCKDALQQLGGEGAPDQRPVSLEPPRGAALLHVVIVPGMFGDCVKRWALPLQDAAIPLRRQGYRVDTIDVGGRSSSATNADTIARALPPLLGPGERLLIIGYSKGMSDILETLAFHPEAIPPGSAVVSLSGIVSGTPLADHPAKLEDVVARIPLENCGSGDHGAVESLSRRHRIEWLADHPLPRDRTYFSIAAFTDAAHISRPLKETYRLLSGIDARNDGQVLYTDAIIPRSHLLGYLNADHWAVALPLAANVPKLSPMFAGRNDYPREILLESVVRSVEEQVGVPKVSRR